MFSEDEFTDCPQPPDLSPVKSLSEIYGETGAWHHGGAAGNFGSSYVGDGCANTEQKSSSEEEHCAVFPGARWVDVTQDEGSLAENAFCLRRTEVTQPRSATFCKTTVGKQITKQNNLGRIL